MAHQLSWQRIHLQCGRPEFHLWAGKIPWRRERLPTPVFWSREFHGLYSPWGRKESNTIEWLSLSLFICVCLCINIWVSLVAQMVKNPPAMWETRVWSLGWEGPLEKVKATHSSILAGELHGLYSPWNRKESDTTEWLSLSRNSCYNKCYSKAHHYDILECQIWDPKSFQRKKNRLFGALDICLPLNSVLPFCA